MQRHFVPLSACLSLIRAHGRAAVITLGVLALFGAALMVALWLAGFIYLALIHHNPLHAGVWVWIDGVTAYFDGRLPKERRHLLASAVMALMVVFGGPLLGWLAIQDQVGRRELHGSARFAAEREIRKAGLL